MLTASEGNAQSNDVLQVPPILLAKSRVMRHKSLVGATKFLVYMSLSKLSRINFLVITIFSLKCRTAINMLK